MGEDIIQEVEDKKFVKVSGYRWLLQMQEWKLLYRKYTALDFQIYRDKETVFGLAWSIHNKKYA